MITQKSEDIYTIYDENNLTTIFDGTQVPTQIWQGTQEDAQNMVDRLQPRIDKAQAVLDAINGYDPNQVQTRIDAIKSSVANIKVNKIS